MPFRRVREREIHKGPLLRYVTVTFAGPDGDEFEREIVEHPGAVSIVPIVDEGTSALLVRQFRAPLGRDLLEIPAGKRDVADEPPETTARRELEEEIGMRAGRLEKLAEFYNSPGFCDEHSFVFMGLDLTPCGLDRQGVEERHMTIEKVALEDVPGLVARGELTDAKSIIGLCLARDALS